MKSLALPLALVLAAIGLAVYVQASAAAEPETVTVLIEGDAQEFVLWKAPRTSPVTMYYDPLGETWAVPDSVILAALTEWNSVTPAFQYIYGGRIAPGAGQTNTCTSSPPAGTNTISWAPLSGTTLARACVWSTSQECDIQMDNGAQPILLDPEAFRTVLLHEAGHCLSLAHSNDAAAVMYPSYTVGHPKHLSADDIAGVCALYGCPGGTPTPRTPTPVPTPADTVVVTPTLTPTRTPTLTPTPNPTPAPHSRLWAPQVARD